MASYSISNITENSVDVKVSGLSSNYTYDIRIFVRLSNDTSDVTYDETTTVSYTTSYSETISGLDENTDYTINVGINEGSGNVWIGSKTFTTDEIVEEEKPDTFSWTYAKTQDGAFNLTATEWNNFTSRINEERAYLGLSAYSFTKAVKGNNFTASMYNQAVNAIKGMGGGAGGYIYTVSKGDTITAYEMNQIVAELNSAINNL